ncbi:MAG TPA: peptidylprolyl isomerase [Bdellovibrionales bacterium]|nr:peptidylprolyl isomerase [Bdellovibrionales bacterium]
MNIADQTVVSMHYTLKDDQGQVLDSSAGGEPLVYLHGASNIVPGLEEALTGKTKGDKLNVTVPPEKAYGQRDERMVQTVPKTQFPNPERLKQGMQFQVRTDHGPMILTVVEIKPDGVVVDGNPELAGRTLHFEVEITDVRKATDEELQHGHAHGPGGHHHG